MEVISSVFSLGVSVRGYNEDVLKELLREQHPEVIFLTEITGDSTVDDRELFSVYRKLNEIVGAKLVPVGVDYRQFEQYRSKYVEEHLSTPELSIKRNMLELIDDTINNYLSQYWKGPETVNSEVTDSLFRAKHKLFSSVFYELESETWDRHNQDILDRIEESSPPENSVILSTVESRYWFNDRISDILS